MWLGSGTVVRQWNAFLTGITFSLIYLTHIGIIQAKCWLYLLMHMQGIWKAGYPTESLLQFMDLNSICIHNGIKMQCFNCSTVLQPNSHIDFCSSITPLFTSAVWRPVHNGVTVSYLAFELDICAYRGQFLIICVLFETSWNIGYKDGLM